MMFDPYLTQKLIAARHADIQRAMQQSRRHAQPGQSRLFMQYTVSWLAGLFSKRDARLPQTSRQSEMYG